MTVCANAVFKLLQAYERQRDLRGNEKDSAARIAPMKHYTIQYLTAGCDLRNSNVDSLTS